MTDRRGHFPKIYHSIPGRTRSRQTNFRRNVTANECTNSRERVICKIDLVKAYDHVDLSFYGYILNRRSSGDTCEGWSREEGNASQQPNFHKWNLKFQQ